MSTCLIDMFSEAGLALGYPVDKATNIVDT